MTKKTFQKDTERSLTDPLLQLISAGAGGTMKGGDIPVITG